MCAMHAYVQDMTYVQYVMFHHLVDGLPSSRLSLDIDSTIVCIDVRYMVWYIDLPKDEHSQLHNSCNQLL